MSGIFGIFNLDGRPVQRRDLDPMLATLERRGPDGSGMWIDGPVGLGHAMLRTTPESLREQPPVVNRRGDLVITADVRLDNRAELIDALGLRGRPAETIGDQELILTAYARWGEVCPARLLGAFAFAIWDKRKRTLFCARDHFGVKPFLYHHAPGEQFAFGSAARIVLASARTSRRINEARIADYLVGGLEGVDKTSTFYQQVFRFPPAHWITVTAGGVSRQRYWNLDPSREIRYRTEAEYTEAFREAFTQAVQDRLRSPSTPAFMMSGGMDSTAIVGVARDLAARNGGGPLPIFSAVSAEGTDCDETRCINAMLRLDGLQATTVRPDQLADAAPDLDYLLRRTDNLYDAELISVPLPLYSAAHRQGVKVMVDGVFGDNVVALGDGYISFLLRQGQWRNAVTEARGFSALYPTYASPWKLLYRSSRAAYLSPLLRRLAPAAVIAARGRRRDQGLIRASIIDPAFARRVDVRGRLRMERTNTNPAPPRTLREATAHMLDAPFMTVALERYDRVASMLSIEPRHPFLDKRLVEFSLALPWEQKMHKGQSKVALRNAVAGLLPAEVLAGGKWAHLAWSFLQSWSLVEQDRIEEVMQNRLERIGEYARTAVVRQAHQSYWQTRAPTAWMNLWRAVTLMLWL